MKKRLALILTVCLLGLVFTSCAGSPNQSPETVEVIRGDLIISATISGNLEMPRKTDLSFGTAGMIKEITVSEGDEVSKGQILAKLDTPSLEATIRIRQAEYEMVEYQLLQTIYPHYTKTHGVNLPGAWMALDKAQENLEEAQGFLDKGKPEEAQVSLNLLKENLVEAQRESQSRTWALPLSIKLAELQVDAAQAALDMAKADLAKAIIVAPFDGIVAGIYINEEQQLSAMTYTNPAIALIDTSKVEMNGFIDEMDIARIRLEQEAIIALDALPDKKVKGEVTFISPAGTVQAGIVSYKTTITLVNPGKELRDGMSATAEIIIDRSENVLLLPNRAIRGSFESPFVEVIVDEQVEKRQVALGLSNGMNTEVLSGLKQGEEVVLPPVSQPSFMPFG